MGYLFWDFGFGCPYGAVGFPPRAGNVGVKVSSCVCRLGMFLPIVFSMFWEIRRGVFHSWCVGCLFLDFGF